MQSMDYDFLRALIGELVGSIFFLFSTMTVSDGTATNACATEHWHSHSTCCIQDYSTAGRQRAQARNADVLPLLACIVLYLHKIGCTAWASHTYDRACEGCCDFLMLWLQHLPTGVDVCWSVWRYLARSSLIII
jgi:hypothetical protein